VSSYSFFADRNPVEETNLIDSPDHAAALAKAKSLLEQRIQAASPRDMLGH